MSELELTKIKTRLEGFEKIVSKFIDIAEELKSEISEALTQIQDEEYEKLEQQAKSNSINN